MCRLFGFRSIIYSQVHESLVNADNALQGQSQNHPDGWGVAYYIAGSPHIVKSCTRAVNDNIFKKVSGVVSSETVIAHIRKTTQGQNNILNTHPFQFGRWVFAHNGNIKGFEQKREKIVDTINPRLRRFILGDTDSEVIFYFILSKIQTKYYLSSENIPVAELQELVTAAIEELVKIIGPYSEIDNAGNQETYLTFLLTDGKTLLAHQGGKNLYYSTYKKRCQDRDDCPHFTEACENPTKDGQINHLIFSSEPLSDENIWIPMKLGQVIATCAKMKLYL